MTGITRKTGMIMMMRRLTRMTKKKGMTRITGATKMTRKTWMTRVTGQRAKKVLSDSPGLVDFAVGLVNCVFNLPDGQVMFYEEFE